jgi:TonB family protein
MFNINTSAVRVLIGTILFLGLAQISVSANAQPCSSERDYELGLQHGLKMVPPCKKSAELNSKPQEKPTKKNFLTGMCVTHDVENDEPPVTSCSRDYLSNRPSYVTAVEIYYPSSITVMAIFGEKHHKYLPRGVDDLINEVNNVSYKVINSNIVISTTTTSNGCVVSNKFIKSGSKVFEESLPLSGNCSRQQLAANQNAISNGKKLVKLISAVPPPDAVHKPSPPLVLPAEKSSSGSSAQFFGSCEVTYPAMSKRMNEKGTVVVKVLVKSDGTAGDVELKSSSGYPRLDQAWLEAIKTCRFTPATGSDGKSIDEWLSAPNTFRLN